MNFWFAGSAQTQPRKKAKFWDTNTLCMQYKRHLNSYVQICYYLLIIRITHLIFLLKKKTRNLNFVVIKAFFLINGAVWSSQSVPIFYNIGWNWVCSDLNSPSKFRRSVSQPATKKQSKIIWRIYKCSDLLIAKSQLLTQSKQKNAIQSANISRDFVLFRNYVYGN